jgi:hypothetical protein
MTKKMVFLFLELGSFFFSFFDDFALNDMILIFGC